MKGSYGNKPADGTEKNKANSKHVLSAVEWANFETIPKRARGMR
ncbi:MAG: hypothetical protein ACYSTT_08780 [Planctomycetota bacterium]|jgi:hypothetical protein